MMARLMVLSMLVVLLVTLPSALGLQCYSCSHFKMDQPDASVIASLGEVGKENANCQGSNTANFQRITCSPASGKTSQCVNTQGSISGGAIGVTFQATVAYRGCVDVDAGANDRCDVDKTGVLHSFGTVNSFTGKECYCTGELCNGEARLTATIVTSLIGLLITMAVNY